MLRTKNATNKATDRCCETLTPDVVPSEAHQSDHSYVHVRDLCRPTFNSFQDGGRLHEGPQKTTKQSKLRGGRLPGTIWLWGEP